MDSNPSTNAPESPVNSHGPHLARSNQNYAGIGHTSPEAGRSFLLPCRPKQSRAAPFFSPAGRSKASKNPFFRHARASPTDSEAHRRRKQPDPPPTRPRAKLWGGSMAPAVATTPRSQMGTCRPQTRWNGCGAGRRCLRTAQSSRGQQATTGRCGGGEWGGNGSGRKCPSRQGKGDPAKTRQFP